MVPDDEDDDDAKSQAGAPVKLEKKYGAKTVATVNNLDERLIPYDLVRGDVAVFAYILWLTFASRPTCRSSVFSSASASKTRPTLSTRRPF